MSTDYHAVPKLKLVEPHGIAMKRHRGASLIYGKADVQRSHAVTAKPLHSFTTAILTHEQAGGATLANPLVAHGFSAAVARIHDALP